jgi:flagellar biosynthesis/type III secretory pathway M-ring protein FliF/YscJ
MTIYVNWLGFGLSLLFSALLAAAIVALVRRRIRRRRAAARENWLTDQMVQQIIEVGALSERQVPEEALNLEEIAKEEERFWTETWDEPDHYWE